MVSLKLKFKIEILNQISSVNSIHLEDNSFSSFKSKSKFNTKNLNLRKGEPTLSDYETLPGFEKEISALSTIEEKEEILQIVKSINFNTLAQIFAIINEKKIYTKLKSSYGLQVLKKTFEQILSNKNRILFNETEYFNSEDSLILSNDCELYIFLQEIFNLSELDAMELYDLFKYNEFFAISDKFFIMIILLLASYECGQLRDYMELFQEEIFIVVSGNEKYISLSKLKDIARLLGFDENSLSKLSEELKLEFNIYVDLETFKKFYTPLAKIYDEQFKSETYLQDVGKNKKNQDKAKTSGCMNKACNIL